MPTPRKSPARSLAPLALTAAFGLLSTVPASAQQFQYTLTDLGFLTGGNSSDAYGINDAGQVVGDSTFDSSGYYHAVLFNGGATPTDLGTLGGPGSYAAAINDAGLIVGQADLPNNNGSNAFAYQNGTLTNLGTLPLNGNFSSSSASSVNDSGLIVGTSNTAQFSIAHGFSYQHGINGVNGASSMPQDLGTFDPSGSSASSSNTSEANAVNNIGQIAGSSFITGQSSLHAFLETNGTKTPLGDLGGGYSRGDALNDSGQVVGFSGLASGDQHAFVYTGGKMTDLGTLNGHYSYAQGINDLGQIVGYSATALSGPPVYHAFVETVGDNKMTDLNTLVTNPMGFTLVYAFGLNNLGQIVGDGVDSAGNYHAILLTPTAAPEPSPLAALSLGILGLGALAFKARRRPASAV